MTDGENKLVAGELEAIFLPRRDTLGASFRHRGEELLRRLENLETAAAKFVFGRFSTGRDIERVDRIAFLRPFEAHHIAASERALE